MSPGFNDENGTNGYTSVERRRRSAKVILRETPGNGS